MNENRHSSPFTERGILASFIKDCDFSFSVSALRGVLGRTGTLTNKGLRLIRYKEPYVFRIGRTGTLMNKGLRLVKGGVLGHGNCLGRVRTLMNKGLRPFEYPAFHSGMSSAGQEP